MTHAGALLHNLSATTVQTALITGFQLLSVPVFLHYWGVVLYGEWIALNVLVAYFQVADLGLNTATANSLTFCWQKKDQHRFNALLTNNLIFICAAFGVLFFVVAALSVVGALSALFRFEVLTPDVMHAGLFLLLAQVFVGTLNNLLNGVYRAGGRFARGTMIDNVIRSGEYSVLLGGVVTGLTIPAILLLGLIVKVVGLSAKFIDARRMQAFSIRPGYYSATELRAMLSPALSFALFPVSSAVALQGPVLLLNALMGGAAVVLFTTTRMLVNFGRAAIEVLHRSAWPEVSLAYARNDLKATRWLHRRVVVWSLALALGTSIMMVVLGGQVYEVWTNGAVPYSAPLTYALLATLMSNTLWSSSGIVLQATNNHIRLSVLYFGAAIACVLLSFVILRLTEQLVYLPLALLASDIMMAAYVLRRALMLTSDSYADFAANFGSRS